MNVCEIQQIFTNSLIFTHVNTLTYKFSNYGYQHHEINAVKYAVI